MATLRERQIYRERVLTALYEATEGNRLLGVPGRKLRNDLRIPEEDLAAACTYLAGEGLITVDWEPGNTPAMVSLTHRGIRAAWRPKKKDATEPDWPRAEPSTAQPGTCGPLRAHERGGRGLPDGPLSPPGPSGPQSYN
ncbi:hypothetical protein ACWCQE_13695 [Streptomyces sp. NPDC002409]